MNLLSVLLLHIANAVLCFESIASERTSINGLNEGGSTSSGSPEDAAALCHEDCPPCDIVTMQYDTFPYRFLTPEQGYVDTHIYLVMVNESQDACSLDPLRLITDETALSASLTELYITLSCVNNYTRLVFRPARDLSEAFLSLDIESCTVYWKDLSYLAQFIDIRVLYLHNWYDEFSRNESTYYDQCVKVEDWSTIDPDFGRLIPDDLLTPSMERLLQPISGLARVGTLRVRSPGSSVLSPVFTRHLWPHMAEVVFSGCYIGSKEAKQIPLTMPQLQTLVMSNVGSSAMITDFPWTNHTLFLPLNLSRTLNVNDHYSESIGIKLLPPNIYRRIYVLHKTNLDDLNDHTFHGALNRIQLKYCNITALSNRTFGDVIGLQSLEISYTNIDNLPMDVFWGLEDLITLTMDHNALRHLPRDLFLGLENLRHIDLAGNRLIEINSLIFSNLYNLETIDLSDNELRAISDAAMGKESSDFLHLQSVKLNNNVLDDFPVWLVYLRSLTQIDLSSNRISFPGLQRILGRLNPEHVRLSNSHSGSAIEDAFRPASKKSINLKKNDISRFDFAVLNSIQLTNLKLLLNFFELDLRENPLECDCKMFQFYEYLQQQGTSESDTYESLKVLPYNLQNTQCNSSSSGNNFPVVEVPATIFGCIEEVSGCPLNCDCWVRSLDDAVVVKCASRDISSLPSEVPNKTIHIDLSQNDIDSIPMPLVKYVDNLEIIDVSHNLLEDVGAALLPLTERVSQLLLHGNKLHSLPQNVSSMVNGVFLTLAGNPFVCDCHSLWMKEWLISRRNQVMDLNDITCASDQLGGQVLIDVPDEDFICVVDPTIYIASAGSVAGFLLLIIVAAIPAYKYRGEIKIYLYMHFDWHPFDRTDDTDILGKDFDAFVSYSREDAHWVCNVLRHRLEPKFQLCLHDRDFMVGAAVAENICSAVNTSRRMILVLSRAFLRSHWCYLEFRQAHYRVLKDRSNYLIVVLHEDVSTEELDKDMRMYLKTNTYLSRDNRWFWEKLFYAMPQRPLQELRSTIRQPEAEQQPKP